MKKLILENKLAFGAGLAVVVLLVAVSYASNNNLNKLSAINSSSPLYALAQEISSAYPNIITNKGIANSLASKVMEAQKALNENDKEDAVDELNDLINEVNAQTQRTDKKGKQITAEEVAKLTSLANAAIAQIQNPAPACPPRQLLNNGSCCPTGLTSDGVRCI